MLEDLGLMEAHDGNFVAATSYFQQARRATRSATIFCALSWKKPMHGSKQENPKRALDLMRSVLRIISDAPASALLRKVELQLAPARLRRQLRERLSRVLTPTERQLERDLA